MRRIIGRSAVVGLLSFAVWSMSVQSGSAQQTEGGMMCSMPPAQASSPEGSSPAAPGCPCMRMMAMMMNMPGMMGQGGMMGMPGRSDQGAPGQSSPGSTPVPPPPSVQ